MAPCPPNDLRPIPAQKLSDLCPSVRNEPGPDLMPQQAPHCREGHPSFPRRPRLFPCCRLLSLGWAVTPRREPGHQVTRWPATMHPREHLSRVRPGMAGLHQIRTLQPCRRRGDGRRRGLFGDRGHQRHDELPDHPGAGPCPGTPAGADQAGDRAAGRSGRVRRTGGRRCGWPCPPRVSALANSLSP